MKTNGGWDPPDLLQALEESVGCACVVGDSEKLGDDDEIALVDRNTVMNGSEHLHGCM